MEPLVDVPWRVVVDAAAFSAISSGLLSVIKPWLDSVPYLSPGDTRRTSLMQVILLLINFSLTCLFESVIAHSFAIDRLGLYASYALVQTFGANLLYRVQRDAGGESEARGRVARKGR